MENPFKKIVKTAQETQKEFEKNDASSIDSRKCPNCGAARPIDSNLTTCAYCDYLFMEVDAQIKLKK